MVNSPRIHKWWGLALICVFAASLSACATGPKEEDLRWLRDSSASASESPSSERVVRIAAVDEVRPGNLILISCPDDSSLNGRFQVAFTGQLELPYGKRISTAGLTIRQLEERVRETYRDYFTNQKVSIAVKRVKAEVFIEVRGLVQKPGRYQASRETTLEELIAKAGGQAAGTQAEYVVVNDGINKPFFVHLDSYYQKGENPFASGWNGGETVALLRDIGPEAARRASPSIRLFGEVKQPGQFALVDGADIYHNNAKAGGPTTTADDTKVELIRGENHERRSLTMTLKEFSDHVKLKSGDVVVVHANISSPLERQLQVGSSIASVLTTLIVLLVAVF